MTRRILVTRPAGQAEALCNLLRERGLTPVAVPTVAIDRASSAKALDAMLERLEGADWLVITSANGADALSERMSATDRVLPSSLRVAAVGPATAEALWSAGLSVDRVPAAYLTVAIADSLGEIAGRRIVLARADAATPALSRALARHGAQVEEVVAYRTIEGPPDSRDRLRVALEGLDGIAFTSSSTVRGLLRLASAAEGDRARRVPAFCIGPVTAATAREYGFNVPVVAREHTAPALARAIADALDERINDPVD